MHVLLVGPYPFPGDLGRGGVERVMQVLRRGLAQRHLTSVIVPNTRRFLRHRDELGQIVYLKRPPIPGFISYWSWSSWAVRREIERLSPDVVHVQDVAGFARLWPSRDMARRCAVFTAHGVLEKDLRQAAGTSRLRRATAPLRAAVVDFTERRSRRRFDDIIAINEYLTEAMPDLAGRRLHWIPNPVDEVFLHTPHSPRDRKEGFELLQVGLINARKNIAGSIAVVHELVRQGLPVRLHIVGAVAEPAYHAQCLAEIRERELEDAVIFHGEAAPGSIACWMDRADALVLLSAQETAPMVVAEAHCRGLPVAARSAFGLPSMVTDGTNGVLLEGRSVADDARKVRDALLASWDKARIRDEARARYNPETVIDRTEAVYCAMLAGRARTRRAGA